MSKVGLGCMVCRRRPVSPFRIDAMWVTILCKDHMPADGVALENDLPEHEADYDQVVVINCPREGCRKHIECGWSGLEAGAEHQCECGYRWRIKPRVPDHGSYHLAMHRAGATYGARCTGTAHGAAHCTREFGHSGPCG